MTTTKEAYIIGKHPSVKEFADLIPTLNDTYGINQVATLYKTKYAFTGHRNVLDELKQTNPDLPIIISKPLFGRAESHISEYYHSINQKGNEDVNRYIDLTDGELRYHMLNAFQKNTDFYFPNYWTVLHLLLFYLIWHDYRRIHLIGCNLDNGFWPLEPKKAPYAKEHTTRMVSIAKEMGIDIFWHKSRSDYDDYWIQINTKEMK